MRDPTINLVTRELTRIAIAYLCEREMLELSDAIDANSVASNELLKTYVWPKDAREAEDRLLVFRARKRNRKRGAPSKRGHHIRIAGAIALLVDAGFDPTRSHCERRRQTPSACSLVAAALKQLKEPLGERRVEGIWAQYRRSPGLRHRGSKDYIRSRYQLSSLKIPSNY